MKSILKRIKKFANNHYESGWDLIVEAYTDAELLELFDAYNASTYKEAKAACKSTIDINEYANQNASEWG